MIGTSIPPLAGQLPPRMMSSPAESAPAWCVAQVGGGFETFARIMVERDGVAEQILLPMERRRQIIKGCARDFSRPLIPGYLFVLLDLARDGWQRINRTPGVIGLLYRSPDRPALVPRLEMARLLGMIDEDGFIVQKAPEAPVDLKGKPLKVTDGPFSGFEGICQWSSRERVAVLLHILGQERPVPLLRSQVSTAG